MSRSDEAGTLNRGIFFALGAYLFWGLHPIYWRLLRHVPSVEIVCHRVFWSFVFFLLIMSFRRDWKKWTAHIRAAPNPWIVYIPAGLIGSNWALYIWAVNTGYILETSLGYFICPLLSVFLGVVFLKERLRPVQWSAVVIAAAGVLVMTVIYGQFPWIAISLAVTWGIYGLLRKKSPLSSTEGLTLETAILSLPALIYLGMLHSRGSGSFYLSYKNIFLLIGSGVTSGLPLLVFIAGARRVSLSLIGIMQYVYPTLIFLVGHLIFREPLNEAKTAGFIFIWSALILYTAEGTARFRKRTRDS
ncbi:EamA family transporter RarD [bacterium]|nr:EamA family transporter RarD [bacterium]